ncbi:GYD domain-containing protein [Pseudopelagicola sp. nBUS_19]|uniref:GYD domain-containing protein n=1 Tax=Pseudopelagicola sp. nBUS_19 TaxID=3395316 RepID=UPI003EBEB5F1
MPLYCLQGRYTKASLTTIIENKEDRTAAAAAACESVGGKLVCMYGASGQDYHIMAIADMPSLQSYMALYMKIMQSGAFETLKTINLYTGADVAAAAEMASGASYSPPN